ncbi:MAG: methyltransferase domain-containing protein [Campylobacterota bacterium]|nr:methyltransferase domain-containing protein [Campylobacterota bacterium]
MRAKLQNRTSKEILEWFKSSTCKEGDTFELEFSRSDIQRIGYKAFVDLAQLFYMKMLTPLTDTDMVILRFIKLRESISFHKADDNGSEKYGVQSEFFCIDKTLQFSFLYHYEHALEFINIKDKKRVLNLGINRGDEFRVIKELVGDEDFKQIKLLGIDYSNSVIEFAKQDFKEDNVEFTCKDINKLQELSLGRFDLIISIGTLQSSNINFNATLMSLYQNYLQKGGSIILGFPNCRWIDSEMIYGASAPNYNFSEMSLVLKDIHFCKKYLQQKGYRVIVTGKDYLFLTARKILPTV